MHQLRRIEGVAVSLNSKDAVVVRVGEMVQTRYEVVQLRSEAITITHSMVHHTCIGSLVHSNEYG